MSTTLTNGLKLPDKGSVDWYADMQSNYAILDGAVGTVAEHTTALAGKAPLVHTHTKADITDLFNSANVWSGENKYTSGFILSNISWSGVTPPSSTKPTVIEFKNADTRQGRYINRISSTSSETWIETIRNVDANTSYNHTVILKVDNSGNKSVYPSSNNDVDLGINANQWNNLYAKNYYYNGTAWGLDKANVYSLEQTISATSGKSWNVKNTNYTLGENTPSSDKLVGAFAVQDNANNNAFLFNLNHYSNGEIISRWLTRFKFANGVKSTTGTQKAAVIEMGLTNSGDRFARPGTNGDMDLGTSTNKWKSFNGINPGALGLPSGNYEPINTNGWDLTGATGQSYTPTVNGWLFISIQNIAGNYLSIVASRGAVSVDGTGAQNGLRAMLPVIANESVGITVKTSVIFAARFYPMQGNS